MARAAGRIDAPAVIPIASPPAEILFDVSGHKVRLRGWSHAEWCRLQESDRPRSARMLGSLGWVALEPEAE